MKERADSQRKAIWTQREIFRKEKIVQQLELIRYVCSRERAMTQVRKIEYALDWGKKEKELISQMREKKKKDREKEEIYDGWKLFSCLVQ